MKKQSLKGSGGNRGAYFIASNREEFLQTQNAQVTREKTEKLAIIKGNIFVHPKETIIT
jgi:hypothetical protein